MKWTNLVHVLIEKVEALIQGVSQLVLIAQVLVKLLEQHSKEELLSFGEGERLAVVPDAVGQTRTTGEPSSNSDKRRGTIHISDLELAEGEWLMDTTEACDVLGISRVTLGVRREEGLLTKVEIGKKGGGVRYISSEIMEMRQWYSVPKGKV